MNLRICIFGTGKKNDAKNKIKEKKSIATVTLHKIQVRNYTYIFITESISTLEFTKCLFTLLL